MTLKNTIVNTLENISRFMYSWLTDNDEILGRIVYTIHMLGFYTLSVLIFISHTIYPVFWFQMAIFLFVLIIWIQHLILKTCVLTSLERKLMGPENPTAIDILLNAFGIPVMKETRMGVTILTSTLGVMFLGLELIARSVMYMRQWIGLSVWI